jgi:hypothetical protein
VAFDVFDMWHPALPLIVRQSRQEVVMPRASGSAKQKDDEGNDEQGSEYAAADIHMNLRLIERCY